MERDPIIKVLQNTFGAPEMVVLPPELRANYNLLPQNPADPPYYVELATVDARSPGRHHQRNETTKQAHEYPPLGHTILNVTGAWGRGPEVITEAEIFSQALPEDLHLILASLPGHGYSSQLPDGWNQPAKATQANQEQPAQKHSDFDQTAGIMAALLQYIHQRDYPTEKTILSAWSMGGITALKTAARVPHLVDGIILFDTPVFPQNAAALVLRFILYGMFHPPKPESSSELALPNDIQLFQKRYRERNKDGGMPILNTVIPSVLSLAKQDLSQDGTLARVAKNQTPILLIHGDNDLVVPKAQMLRLEETILTLGGPIVRTQVKHMGHGLERPGYLAREIIAPWIKQL